MSCLHEILKCLTAPPAPYPINLYAKEQVAMSIFRLKFSLPGPTASDVTIQRFGINAANTTGLLDFLAANSIPQPPYPIQVDYPATQALSDWYYVDLPDSIVLSLADLDAAGNASATVTRTLDEVDDVAPPSPDPDQLSVAEKEQV